MEVEHVHLNILTFKVPKKTEKRISTSNATSRSSSVSSTSSTRSAAKSTTGSTTGQKKAASVCGSEDSIQGVDCTVSERSSTGSTPIAGKPSGKLAAYAKLLSKDQGQGDNNVKEELPEDKEDVAVAYMKHLSDMADLYRQVRCSFIQVHGQGNNKFLLLTALRKRS